MVTLLTLAAWALAGVAACALIGRRDRLASLPWAIVFGPMWILIAMEQTDQDERDQQLGLCATSHAGPFEDRRHVAMTPALIDLTESASESVKTSAGN